MCRVPGWLAQVATAGRASAPAGDSRRGFACCQAGKSGHLQLLRRWLTGGIPRSSPLCAAVLGRAGPAVPARPLSQTTLGQGRPEGLMSLPGLRVTHAGTEGSSWAVENTSPWEGLAPGGNEAKVRA